MAIQEAQSAKLIASQRLRIQHCKSEIAQFEVELADIDLIVAAGGVPLVSKETIERLSSEPKSRLIGLETELTGLLNALGRT